MKLNEKYKVPVILISSLILLFIGTYFYAIGNDVLGSLSLITSGMILGYHIDTLRE